MARKNKSLYQGCNSEFVGYKHREHRSKKGRKLPIHQYGKLVIYKMKLNKLKQEEVLEQLKNYES